MLNLNRKKDPGHKNLNKGVMPKGGTSPEPVRKRTASANKKGLSCPTKKY